MSSKNGAYWHIFRGMIFHDLLRCTSERVRSQLMLMRVFSNLAGNSERSGAEGGTRTR